MFQLLAELKENVQLLLTEIKIAVEDTFRSVKCPTAHECEKTSFSDTSYSVDGETAQAKIVWCPDCCTGYVEVEKWAQ